MEKEASSELKPCPFCGGTMMSYVRDKDVGRFIRCNECGARGPNSFGEDGAIAGWNEALRPEEKPDATEAVRKLVEPYSERIDALRALLDASRAQVARLEEETIRLEEARQ